MRNIFLSLVLVTASFGVNAGIFVDVESPEGEGFGTPFSWTHTFTPIVGTITDATIEITHSFLGFFGPGPEGAASLSVDGVFLDYFTDGDSCDPTASDCSLYSGTYVDIFTLPDFSTLDDGSVTFTIDTGSGDGWFLGETFGIDEASVLTISYVPEPSIIALLGLGLLGLGFARRKVRS